MIEILVKQHVFWVNDGMEKNNSIKNEISLFDNYDLNSKHKRLNQKNKKNFHYLTFC